MNSQSPIANSQMNRQSPIANSQSNTHHAQCSFLWLLAIGYWLCAAAAPAAAPAATIPLAWDASPDSLGPNGTNITYVLYAHTNSISVTNIAATAVRVRIGTNLTAVVEITNAGRWFFVVTAARDGTESVQSNQVIWEIIAPPPNMRTVFLQYSGTLTNFYDVGFFRLRLP